MPSSSAWRTQASAASSSTWEPWVSQALEEGITTFDTADTYADTAAESVLGKALAGERREGLEIFTKVYFPIGQPGPNDHGLSRKHILESIDGSLRPLGTDYVDLYQAHRFDYDTPLEETMEAFADVVRSGKALYIGVSEWTAERDPPRSTRWHASCTSRRCPTSRSTPCSGGSSRPRSCPPREELGIGQIVWSPIGQGVLTGKYKPGQDWPAGSRATDEKGGADMISALARERRAHGRAAAGAGRRGGRAHDGPARRRVGAAEPWRLRARSSAPAVPSR